MHSGGNKLTLKLLENEQQVEIIISDNGKGISSSDIPHILRECINVTVHVLPGAMAWGYLLRQNL